ncbi:polysaccharide pyruvyl transferase family protein [Rhodococcus sp. F64268]|uniref:polysaccharide pyruvyl transferase family protein n=1 Tax=Rhodococcus sp. F64268 TaxID=2926402 RepID=UPI001FF418DE|nr:polysaccharide pyruvyl transferase family protein [Rhodococcus sp. F64268]MCK0090487.1 polysaccharide pyruvyl transferase family protein [Rhodococcus sp. F64268]
MTVGLLDTSYESDNDGDGIIVGSIIDHYPFLSSLQRFPTHRRPNRGERKSIAQCDALVVTGTNILTSKMWRDRQWKMSLRDQQILRDRVIFLGVGWRQYQPKPTRFNSEIIRRLVHPGLPVAVRDAYTQSRLESLGIRSINTGCPTMWALPAELPALGRSAECVFTLTSYSPDSSHDCNLLKSLSSKYDAVHIWAQGDWDERNLQNMELPANAFVLERGIPALSRALVERDYVGTRLHAGIRAAQLGRPSLVVAVDNRAIEIGRDTGFPVVARRDGLIAFEEAIEKYSCNPVDLRIPHESISRWDSEFKKWLHGLASRDIKLGIHDAGISE